MSADDLLQRIRERPFRPFVVVTTDGTKYEVRHPEMLMPGRRTVTIGVPDDPVTPVYDQQVILFMLHLQRLEFLPTQPSTANEVARRLRKAGIGAQPAAAVITVRTGKPMHLNEDVHMTGQGT